MLYILGTCSLHPLELHFSLQQINGFVYSFLYRYILVPAPRLKSISYTYQFCNILNFVIFKSYLAESIKIIQMKDSLTIRDFYHKFDLARLKWAKSHFLTESPILLQFYIDSPKKLNRKTIVRLLITHIIHFNLYRVSQKESSENKVFNIINVCTTCMHL